MSIREEQCNKVCRILDDVLANRPTERDSLIVAVRKAFEALELFEISEQLPSTQPDHEWIPISERLPKENGFYLTSTMYGEVYLDDWNGINWERSEEILAWMPLPEPYREEGDS